jgi:hypothetical protein
LWIGDIEVLRTTTAEPTPQGINWSYERDITVYGEYLRQNSPLYTYISIPNNVDSTYTGIIFVKVSLTLYPQTDVNQILPNIIPLTKATANTNPWTVMTVVGNQSQEYSLPSYNDLASSKSSSDDVIISEVLLEVYASAHGCEEFYYSNVPGNIGSSLGICGNGVYREIQVISSNYCVYIYVYLFLFI